MRCGLVLRKLNPISTRAFTRIGAGTTTPEADSYWTGSAIMETLHTGGWDSILPVHRRLTGMVSFRRQMLPGTLLPNTISNANIVRK